MIGRLGGRATVRLGVLWLRRTSRVSAIVAAPEEAVAQMQQRGSQRRRLACAMLQPQAAASGLTSPS